MEENSGILDGARLFLVNQQVCPCEIQSLVLASCEMKLDWNMKRERNVGKDGQNPAGFPKVRFIVGKAVIS